MPSAVTSTNVNVTKKHVKAKRFWKINAIRPEIRARRGVEPLDKAAIMQGYANW